jgi:hypothetical protein
MGEITAIGPQVSPLREALCQGRKLNGTIQIAQGLVELMQLLQGVRAGPVQLGILGQGFDGAGVIGNGFARLVLGREQLGAITIRDGQPGVELNDAVEIGQRRVEVVLLCERDRAIVNGEGILRVVIDGGLELGQRDAGLAGFDEQFTAPVMGPCGKFPGGRRQRVARIGIDCLFAQLRDDRQIVE